MAAMPTSPRAGTFAGFQDAMQSLAARGSKLDIRVYEVASAETIAADLQPTTLSLLADTSALLGRVIEACAGAPRPDPVALASVETVRTSYLPFERAIDATVAMSTAGSYAAVEEIGFIAQLELRQRAERLRRLSASHGVVVLLSECDSSLRRVRKALNAVDAAIASAEGVSPRLDFTSELQTSLTVRRAYAKFRTRVLAGEEPTPETIRARIRGIGTQIAMVVGWAAYPEMRVRDRLLLRELQQRVLAWLREGEGARFEAGLRLWRDVVSAIEMFTLVNRRQELCDHDFGRIREIAAALQTASVVDPPVWSRAAALEGLDPQLDTLLARDACPSLATLRPILTRLSVQIGAVTAPSGSVPNGAGASSPDAGGEEW